MNHVYYKIFIATLHDNNDNGLSRFFFAWHLFTSFEWFFFFHYFDSKMEPDTWYNDDSKVDKLLITKIHSFSSISSLEGDSRAIYKIKGTVNRQRHNACILKHNRIFLPRFLVKKNIRLMLTLPWLYISWIVSV